MTRFFHVCLRTTDAEAARTFYHAVLEREDLEIFPLHEQARARGAPPHWMGFLDVDDVDAMVAAIVERGGMALGPKWKNAQGLEAAYVRDAGGALFALAKVPQEYVNSFGPDVAWRVLNTNDVERAKRSYGELFGWRFHEPVMVAGVGQFHPFSTAQGESPVGSFGDIAERPGVHPHWLFQLRVADLDRALERVRQLGGNVAAIATTAQGARVAVCEDAQGAQFGLRAS